MVQDRDNPDGLHLHIENCNQCGRCLKVAPPGSWNINPINFYSFQEACARSVKVSLSTFAPEKRVFISLATHQTPVCDCFGFTGAPILPDVGIFGSNDICAIDQATLDMIGKTKLIVLDACHSGAAIGKAGPGMAPEFIARVFTEAEGMAVLASCKQGQQSWEWPEEGRSVFTHFLLEALSGHADLDGKGFVTVSDASRYVTDGVKAWAVEHGVPQTPTLQYTVAGDIVLLMYEAKE